jgi:hypothetical protein
MKKIITSIVMIQLLLYTNSYAQSLAVNTDGSTANASSLMEVKSTTKGVLIPRMSKTQKNAIASPAIGLLIFQNAPDSIGFHYYNGSGWTWLANNTGDQWLITGNSNITAANYIGTSTPVDLRFGVGGFESARATSTGLWGFGEVAPQYNLDVSLGTFAVYPCIRNGLRLKPPGISNDCDRGLFIGLDNNLSVANASIWNYGDGSSSAAHTIKFGLNNYEVARLNSSGFLGLSEPDPQYNLDIRIGAAAVYPCVRNGIRITTPLMDNACDKGLFVGYDNNVDEDIASFWNFADGSTFPGGSVLRFGMGDFVTGETMRLNVFGGMGLGVTDPLAKIHIIDRTGSLLPGLMVTQTTLPPASNGMYFGIRNGGTSTGRVWNYQPADIEIGTNNLQRMIIGATGNVGVATATEPSSTFKVDGTFATGVTADLAGGTIGSPTVIDAEKSIITLAPSANVYYQLPHPGTCEGRIYYLRNNNNGVTAQLGSVAGSICPGSGACLAPGSYYALNAAASGKTVIAISDGSNWVVGKID